VGVWSSRAEALATLRAVKALAAADGLSAGEAARLGEHMADMGAPADVRAAVEAFDPASASLAELVRDIPAEPEGGGAARRLLVAAIAVAVVDGYSEREREAIHEAARMLGVSRVWVQAMEASARLGWMIEALEDDAMADVWAELQAALLELPA